MREILFRCKRVDNGEWVQGDLVRFGKLAIICDSANMAINAIDASTICQYTGLHDGNGNRIFEGDIIKYKFYSITDFSFVVWDEYRWIRRYKHKPEWDTEMRDEDYDKYRAIAGNIFDNPELLEENK